MRKIEEAMCEAVKNRRNMKSGNTEVKVRKDGDTVRTTVYLFENAIYEIIEDHSTGFNLTAFTLADWDTLTTRRRLVALGVKLTRCVGVTYHKGSPIVNKKDWCEI